MKMYAVDKEINKLKKRIVKQKMRENLGEKELRYVKDKYPLWEADYEEDQARRNSILAFSNWCMNLTDKDMER